MKRVIALAAVFMVCGCAGDHKQDGSDVAMHAASAAEYQHDFQVRSADWASVGRNEFFIVEPGHRDTYHGEDGELVITVLNETKTVDGVETRIIEERESANGHLTEVSRNYFAVDQSTGDIYYFGEDVDVYKNDKVTSHPGGWLSGVDGAHYGLFMPAKPRVGQKFQQEYAPNVAMDRCEVVSLSEKLAVPMGSYEGCLKIKETTPLESDKEYKVYAPKIGLLQDEDLKLVEQGSMTK